MPCNVNGVEQPRDAATMWFWCRQHWFRWPLTLHTLWHEGTHWKYKRGSEFTGVTNVSPMSDMKKQCSKVRTEARGGENDGHEQFLARGGKGTTKAQRGDADKLEKVETKGMGGDCHRDNLPKLDGFVVMALRDF